MRSFKYHRACVSSAVCWIFATLLCGVLLGVPSLNFSQEFDYGSLCSGQAVCSVEFTLTGNADIRLYVRLAGIYQNNEYFQSGYNSKQLAGRPGSCADHNTLGEFNISTTAAGYRKAADSAASPCGFAMLSRFNDGFRVVDSYGNLLTPMGAGLLTDTYYPGSQFVRASNYLLSQWLDVQDPLFMGWFMRSSLNDKTMLVSGANGLSAGTYSVVIYNNFEASGKKLLVRTVNALGSDNLVLGFSLLATSLAMFLAMVCLCFHRKRSQNI